MGNEVKRLELEGLTRNVLQEALRQITRAFPGGYYDTSPQKKYLIVVTGGEMGLSQAVDFARACVTEKVTVSLVLSPSAIKLLSKSEWSTRTGIVQIITEQSHASIMDLLKEHQEIIVPILTVNSAAKIALGITDTLATGLIFHGLLMGKPVLAARESCDLDYLNYFMQEGNPGAAALKAKLIENQKALEAMGVKFCTVDQLVDLAKPLREKKAVSQQFSGGSKVITVEDIVPLEPGTTITIGKNTIITPSARDLAAERQINFCRQS
jgi:hypothetical protein